MELDTPCLPDSTISLSQSQYSLEIIPRSDLEIIVELIDSGAIEAEFSAPGFTGISMDSEVTEGSATETEFSTLLGGSNPINSDILSELQSIGIIGANLDITMPKQPSWEQVQVLQRTGFLDVKFKVSANALSKLRPEFVIGWQISKEGFIFPSEIRAAIALLPPCIDNVSFEQIIRSAALYADDYENDLLELGLLSLHVWLEDLFSQDFELLLFSIAAVLFTVFVLSLLMQSNVLSLVSIALQNAISEYIQFAKGAQLNNDMKNTINNLSQHISKLLNRDLLGFKTPQWGGQEQYTAGWCTTIRREINKLNDFLNDNQIGKRQLENALRHAGIIDNDHIKLLSDAINEAMTKCGDFGGSPPSPPNFPQFA